MTYDEMFDEAARLNTCEFIDFGNTEGLAVCENVECCCTECKQLNKDGSCQNRSLLCKLWICDTRRESMPHWMVRRLQELWDIAYIKGWLVFRGSPADATNELTVIKTPEGHYCKVRVGAKAGPKEQRSFKV